MSIIIIGGGQAAVSCAAKVRSLDQDCDIMIIGDEPCYPYQRPPLSKKYLAGDTDLDRLLLRPEVWYQDNRITMRCGCRVVKIDREAHRLALSDGEVLSYDRLVLATGGRPRSLPGSVTQGARGIYAVRTLADVDTMRSEFQSGRSLLMVGGGYIGLEAAAVARKFGVEVYLVEAAPRILGRVASDATADFFRNLHEGHGVQFFEGQGLESLLIEEGRFGGAKLSSGKVLKADFMIVGIGIIPNSDLAEAAGLLCNQGIIVDEHCSTNDPSIYAAGDCAVFQYQGQPTRIESVGNAIDQGEVVACNLVGEAKVYQPKPWFWSDQYDLTLQIAGLNRGYDDTVLRPGGKEGTQSVWYYQGEQLLAVESMGDPRSYMAGKRLIESGKTLPKSVAADPDQALKDWL